MFEIRVLRRIFGLKRDEVIGGWRKLHNEELHNLYSSASIIKKTRSGRMRWARHVERMEKKKECIWVFCGEIRRKEICRKT
jgi:hypothetical protein